MQQTIHAYLRVSGLAQTAGDGFPRQRAAILARAAAYGGHVAAWHEDAGVSGTLPLAARPGLSGALAAVRPGDVLLVERADRVGRDLLVSELALAAFRDAGVRVIDAAGTDLTAGSGDPTAVLLRQLLGAIAQHDRTTAVARMAAARARVRRDVGRCEGPPPYGMLPGEAAVVATVRALARRRCPVTRRRWSAARVAKELDRLGARTRSGRPWSRSVVRKILAR